MPPFETVVFKRKVSERLSAEAVFLYGANCMKRKGPIDRLAARLLNKASKKRLDRRNMRGEIFVEWYISALCLAGGTAGVVTGFASLGTNPVDTLLGMILIGTAGFYLVAASVDLAVAVRKRVA
jgi:hypothetical protein